MMQTSFLAVAALNGVTSKMGTPVQHTAKPNAPPGSPVKIYCTNSDLKAGDVCKDLPVPGKAYAVQQFCSSS